MVLRRGDLSHEQRTAAEQGVVGCCAREPAGWCLEAGASSGRGTEGPGAVQVQAREAKGARRDRLEGQKRPVTRQGAAGQEQVATRREGWECRPLGIEIVDIRYLHAAHAGIASRTVDDADWHFDAQLRVGPEAVFQLWLNDVAPRAVDVGIVGERRQNLELVVIDDEGVLGSHRTPVVEVAVVNLATGRGRQGGQHQRHGEGGDNASHGAPVEEAGATPGGPKDGELGIPASRNTCQLQNRTQFARLLRFALVREQLWPDSSTRTWDHPGSSHCV